MKGKFRYMSWFILIFIWYSTNDLNLQTSTSHENSVLSSKLKQKGLEMSPMQSAKQQDNKASLFTITDSHFDRGSREGTPDFALHNGGAPKSSTLTPSQFKVSVSILK